jgi:hypothetical protein
MQMSPHMRDNRQPLTRDPSPLAITLLVAGALSLGLLLIAAALADKTPTASRPATPNRQVADATRDDAVRAARQFLAKRWEEQGKGYLMLGVKDASHTGDGVFLVIGSYEMTGKHARGEVFTWQVRLKLKDGYWHLVDAAP